MRGFLPAWNASFWSRYFFSAASGSSHLPKYTSAPRIFFAHTPAACGKSEKSGYGLCVSD